MHVGVCRVLFRLPEGNSLKGKRQFLRSLTQRVKNRYNVAIAEVGDNDSWQLVAVGFACVSNDPRHANEMLSKVVAYVESIGDDAELLDYEIELEHFF
ncbi:MAG: DUF503 domain-containing protein [Chloroflexi bacterium]|nr:DUF503 domain-containing protein [Chloroflexota bacterium]